MSNNSQALGSQDSKEETDALRTRIGEILFYKWDPLNLSNSNWPRDEYDIYVPEVVRLALESPSFQPIADYLTQVATEFMSMEEHKDHDKKIAELIFSIAHNKDYYPDLNVVEIE